MQWLPKDVDATLRPLVELCARGTLKTVLHVSSLRLRLERMVEI